MVQAAKFVFNDFMGYVETKVNDFNNVRVTFGQKLDSIKSIA